VRTVFVAVRGAPLAAAVAARSLAAQSAPVPGPTPAPAPGASAITPAPASLRLDLDRHVDDLLARHGTAGLPRFEESVEVVERAQPALDALLAGADLECGPTASGPPPTGDLTAYRGATIPPHADFLAAGKLLWKGLKKLRRPKATWLVYRVRREGASRLVLREGEVSQAARLAAPGTTWEEVARFSDRNQAVNALQRLEQGFATARRRTSGERMPPWVATTCRPR
jgi:hypothetical protein